MLSDNTIVLAQGFLEEISIGSEFKVKFQVKQESRGCTPDADESCTFKENALIVFDCYIREYQYNFSGQGILLALLCL